MSWFYQEKVRWALAHTLYVLGRMMAEQGHETLAVMGQCAAIGILSRLVYDLWQDEML